MGNGSGGALGEECMTAVSQNPFIIFIFWLSSTVAFQTAYMAFGSTDHPWPCLILPEEVLGDTGTQAA